MRKEIVTAPVSGIVSVLCAEEGATVKEGDPIVQIEIMKLMYETTAGISGRINIKVTLGEFIQEGDVVAEIIGD